MLPLRPPKAGSRSPRARVLGSEPTCQLGKEHLLHNRGQQGHVHVAPLLLPLFAAVEEQGLEPQHALKVPALGLQHNKGHPNTGQQWLPPLPVIRRVVGVGPDLWPQNKAEVDRTQDPRFRQHR